jgi:hypothetical protein
MGLQGMGLQGLQGWAYRAMVYGLGGAMVYGVGAYGGGQRWSAHVRRAQVYSAESDVNH